VALIGILLAVLFALLAALVIAGATKAWLPGIIDRLTDRAIKRLPHDQRDRFAEEWKSYVNDTPGDLRKLIAAVGFLFSAKKMTDVPWAHKRVRGVLPRLWHIAACIVKRIAAWPLVVKVPVLVAGLMVTVAVTTSQVVLWRFAED
jgi:hypothetical protein